MLCSVQIAVGNQAMPAHWLFLIKEFCSSRKMFLNPILWPLTTGVDLSKYWVGKPKYWGQKVVKS